MKFSLVFVITFVSFQQAAFCQSTQFEPDSSILFEVSRGKELLRDCSGSRLQEVVDSFWIPHDVENLTLQKNYIQLSSQVKKLDDFVIQYIGIVFEGKRYIYINAFPKTMLKELSEGNDLSRSVAYVCGGGHSFWRVLFEVNKEKFQMVMFNAPM